MVKLVLAFLSALPEIIKLVNTVQRMNKEADTKRKLKDDIKKINEAFEAQDDEALRRIFNNEPDGVRDS